MMNPFEARLMLSLAWRLVCKRRDWKMYFRTLAASPPL